MVSAAAQVGTASAPSGILSVGSAVQSAPVQAPSAGGDAFIAQYSPQIYAVASKTAASDPPPVLTANVFNPNTKLPVLVGSGAIPIPGAPPGWSYPPLLIR